MRGLWCVIVICILPASQAVLEDPSGDVQLNVANQDVTAVPPGIRDTIDLTAIGIEETASAFLFHVGLVALDGIGEDVYSDRQISVTFSHHGVTYRIQFLDRFAGQIDAWLLKVVETSNYPERVGMVDVAEKDGRLTFTVPRDLVPAGDGSPPFPGRAFTDITALSQAPVLASAVVSAYPSIVTGDSSLVILEDRAGDEAPGRHGFVMGVPQDGTGRLTSDQPFRISNGEAGAFVFWVNATGSGHYTLHPVDVPQGWAVQVPAGRIELHQGRPREVPVVVQTAFAHSHGSSESFTLELRDEGGGAGRLEMGILYPEVPQPAGHHDTLHLWSQKRSASFDALLAPAHQAVFGNGGDEAAYMNAAPEDANDLSVPVDFRRCGGALGERAGYCLDIPLVPSLAMGLDFRTHETGTLAVTIDSPLPATGLVLDGYLVHRRYEEGETFSGFPSRFDVVSTVLATIPASVAVDLAAGGSTAIELPVRPTAAADLVGFDSRAELSLRLNITIQDIRTTGIVSVVADVEPRLLPGGTLRLPLNEYQDDIKGIADLGAHLEWAIDSMERDANPGDAILFRAVLDNTGDDDRFTVRLVGQNLEWAELRGAQEFRLDGNATRSWDIIVRVPADAAAGATSDLVLEAASTSDVTRRALLQFRTTVVEEEVPDDAARIDGLAAADRKAPGALLLVPLLWAAMAARRR